MTTITNILLFLICTILFVPLFLLNFIIVMCKGGTIGGFFYSTAYSIDCYGNAEFRTLFNATLIKSTSLSKFGNYYETISSVLGKNKRDGTLTVAGKCLCWLLNRVHKKHVEKSIIEL